jgi:GDPmannose 4,6-dehydratase
MKTALITGITGQDGSYLAELLLEKGYSVHGIIRRSSDSNHKHIAKIKNKITLHQADLSDSICLAAVIALVRPHEIYNLAAQSHVKISFEAPQHTTDINALGPLRILEAIRALNLNTKFYQASTSEMFGMVQTAPQNEETVFRPASPYGAAKLYAHWLVINYRLGYNIFACNGILYNHESPRRGELFVTRKITKGFVDIAMGKIKPIELGNLDSLRDWGHAKDYVRAMWLMLQQDKPDDYVIATGTQASVRDFCNYSAEYFDIQLEWEGSGVDEFARNKKTGDILVKVNTDFYRPVDVVNLLGDASKARKVLKWQPKYSLKDLVSDMCKSDLDNI